MTSGCRLSSSPWAALILALCAGCDGAPRGREATSNGSGSVVAEQAPITFDRQPPGSANRVPTLQGTAGTLRYRPGCLFLDDGRGGEIGLVLPAEATFDGRRLVGALTTPEGEAVAREVGQVVSLTGPVIDNPSDGRYSCDTKKLLVADRF